jgi:hypothetical protein
MSLAQLRRSAYLLVLFGVLACSDDEPRGAGNELPRNASVQVGSKGGTLKTSGMTLEIPEGALDKSVKISATNVGKSAPREIQAQQVSDVYEFGPEGTKFNKDVKVTFHTSKHEPRAEVYFTKEDGSGFEKIKSEKSGTEVTALVKHFSQGFVGVPLDDEPDAGDGDPDAGQDADAAVVDDMDAASASDAGPALDLDASDAAPSIPDGAVVVADAGLDAGPLPKHIVVNSLDRYGVLVNQTWAAFQDGQGPWQVLPAPGKAGIYEFDVTSASYAVAFVCSTPDLVDSWSTITYEPATSTMLAVRTQGTPCTAGAAPVEVNLMGTLTLAPDTYWRIGHSLLTSGINYSGAPAGLNTNLHRNVATDVMFSSGPTAMPMAINRVLLVRDVTLSANVSNFNQTMDAGTMPQGTAQANVLNAGINTNVNVHYVTRGTEDGLLLNTSDLDGGVSFATLPESIRRPTDRYLLLGDDSSGSDFRKASFAAYPSGNLSLALPPLFTTTFSALNAPYLRPTFTFTPVSGANLYAFSVHYSPVRSSDHVFDVDVDPAYLGAGGSQTLTFPDFSQLSGFQTAWVAPSGGSVSVKSMVHVAKSDAMGDLKSESGQSATVMAP